jgi:hypothetical protein
MRGERHCCARCRRGAWQVISDVQDNGHGKGLRVGVIADVEQRSWQGVES